MSRTRRSARPGSLKMHNILRKDPLYSAAVGCNIAYMGDLQKKREAELELIQDVAAKSRSAVITGPAAARWLGLSTYNWVTKVDLALPGETRPWKRGDAHRIYRSGILTDQEYLVHKGVRTATAIRAMFDSFRYHGRTEALVQIESARWKHRHLTTEYLLDKTGALPKARGIAGFRKLIEYATDTSASVLETIVRDAILRAIADGTLSGVVTLEFQVGLRIRERDGRPMMAWADILINGFLVVEADGLEKTSGVMGDAASMLRDERERETQLQNQGAVVRRVRWDRATSTEFIASLQTVIDSSPGVRELPNRVDVNYRDWLEELEQRAA
ncbi:hypothetical protein SAMN04488531_0840 [Corynebacterium coyleae]|nr:hypothetical protein CCOY_11265 [Corynebacterium coyleae]SEB50763.1 hypothetical protein SAMN04488531_0840 [Corynebacterium coyleae]